jgi:hypothetical protein
MTIDDLRLAVVFISGGFDWGFQAGTLSWIDDLGIDE